LHALDIDKKTLPALGEGRTNASIRKTCLKPARSAEAGA
jgi:hypothetical protein